MKIKRWAKSEPAQRPSGKERRSATRTRMMSSPSRDAVPRNVFARARFSLGKLPSMRSLSGGRWLALLAGVGGLVGAGFLFQTFLMDSEYFEVREWSVENTQRLEPAEVKVLARGGDVDWPINLFAFEPAEAAAKLRTHPVIRDARVQREPPDTVRLFVQERQERAVLLGPAGRGLLADIEGVLFAEASTAEILDRGLPLLTASETLHWNVGDRLPPDFVGRVLEYQGTLEASNSPLLPLISEYHWSQEQGLVLVMRSGARLVCGRLRPEETLFKAEGLQEKYPRLAGIATADLRVETHVPWMPEATPTPVPRRR